MPLINNAIIFFQYFFVFLFMNYPIKSKLVMKIVLLGYMGSGKSTIGQKVAKKIGFDFIDLDVYIQNKYHTSINNIFNHRGEIYFRKIEADCVVEICENNEDFVLALGGGTPCYGNTMDYLLSNHIMTIFLKVSINSLFERLLIEKNNRPLISNIDDSDLKEFIAKHLFERSKFYDRANHIINTDLLTIDQFVKQLESWSKLK